MAAVPEETTTRPLEQPKVTFLNQYLPELTLYDARSGEAFFQSGTTVDMNIPGAAACRVALEHETSSRPEVHFQYDGEYELVITRNPRGNVDMNIRLLGRTRKFSNPEGNYYALPQALTQFRAAVEADMAKRQPRTPQVDSAPDTGG